MGAGGNPGIVSVAAVRGDRTLTMAEAVGDKMAPGDFVFVEVDNPSDLSLLKHLTGDGGWSDRYDWSDDNSAQVKNADVYFPVEVAAVAGREVTLRQPLRMDLRTAWNPRVTKMGDVLKNVGLETMTLTFERDYTWSFNQWHIEEPGWNGPWFNNVIHGFARDLTLVDADAGPGVAAAKNVTIQDVLLRASKPELAAHHHGTTARVYSHDILFRNINIESRPYHGLNVEQFSMGVAWAGGQMAHGTFDSHRNLPVADVYTDITLNNDGRRGGGSNAGPVMGARFTRWNVRVTNGRSHMVCDQGEMPNGALIGVSGCEDDGARPFGDPNVLTAPDVILDDGLEDLHRAQLWLRLCDEG